MCRLNVQQIYDESISTRQANDATGLLGNNSAADGRRRCMTDCRLERWLPHPVHPPVCQLPNRLHRVDRQYWSVVIE